MGILDSTFFVSHGDWLVSLFHFQVILVPMLLLAFDESGFPLPLGDFIVIYSGYQVSQGHISFFMAFFLLLIPILLGASFLYVISRRYGHKLIAKLGRYIDIDQEKLSKLEEKYKKYGLLVIIFGRHIIGFRVPITIFSGISDIGYKKFILGIFISVIFWIPFYLSIGMKLGPKALKLAQGNYAILLFFAIPILLLLAGYKFLRKKKHRSKKK